MNDLKLQSNLPSVLWRCPVCQIDNSPLFDFCEMCFTQRIFTALNQPSNFLPNKLPQNLICLDPKCRTENSINLIQCVKCNKFLIEGLQQEKQEQEKLAKKSVPSKKSEPKKKVIICKWCLNENKIDATSCWHCTSVFVQASSSQNTVAQKSTTQSTKPYVPKSKKPNGPSFCEDCKTTQKQVRKGKGYLYKCKCLDLEAIYYVQKSFCNFCFETLHELDDYEKHALQCKKRFEYYDWSSRSYERCTPLQINVLTHVNDRSEKRHFGFQEKLYARMFNLGYSMEDFTNMYFYIANLAPIIIHMHADKHFEFYLNDTHYRNQFQTSKTSGFADLKVRGGWEDSMFDNLYQKARPFQRVKYGTINFTNDPNGVAECTWYGKSYFMLKEHVRDRCTITDEDQTIICNFRFCNELLLNFTDEEIHAAFDGSTAKEIKSKRLIATYKEIQIHGPVEFSKDIERVYIHRDDIKKNPKCLQQVKQFCIKNNLQYEEFGRK